MAKESRFKITNLEAKLGMTVELNGKWVRVDRGVVMENLRGEETLMMSEIQEAFAKAQLLLEKEVMSQIKAVAK